MRTRKNRKRRRHKSGLLLTPFIDIIFLLALFFVLNTSFRQEQYLDVALPESETAEDVRAEGILLTIRDDGTAAVNGEEIAWESLTAAIRDIAERTGAGEVIIRGDQAMDYGRAVDALDRVRLAGLDSISLQTVRSSARR